MKRLIVYCAIWFVISLPGIADACEKCFGGAGVNTPVTQGIGLAMLLLLCVTGCVLSGIVAFFVYIWRRTKRYESGQLLVTEQGNLLNHPRLVSEMGKSYSNL